MSPKDRIRSMSMQTVPGWSLSDKAFHATFAANQEECARIAQVHQSIKAFYLHQGHTLQQWQAVSANLPHFNRVWRQALGLTLDDSPPPRAYRRDFPKLYFQQRNA